MIPVIKKATVLVASVDENGDEGVVGATLAPWILMPLIASDEQRLKVFEQVLPSIKKACPGRKMYLLRLTQREVIKEL